MLKVSEYNPLEREKYTCLMEKDRRILKQGDCLYWEYTCIPKGNNIHMKKDCNANK